MKKYLKIAWYANFSLIAVFFIGYTTNNFLMTVVPVAAMLGGGQILLNFAIKNQDKLENIFKKEEERIVHEAD